MAPRVHPARDVAPGEAAAVRSAISTLPAEDGRYQVFVSPMREDVCWYYEQGWPFLLVEAAVRGWTRPLERVRVATQRTLRRERACARRRPRLHSIRC